MPIDTRDERASCVGIALSVPHLAPAPDVEAETKEDRQFLVWTYAGDLAGAGPGPPSATSMTGKPFNQS